MIETWIELKPREEWREGMTPKKLIADLNKRVGLPGMMDSWGYPIKIRLDMLTTGIRTPIGVKVAGSDLMTIDKIAKNVIATANLDTDGSIHPKEALKEGKNVVFPESTSFVR